MFTTYHGTDSDFIAFSERPIPRGDSVGNCSLGHWVSFSPEVAGKFGQSLLTVDINPTRVAVMTVKELSAMHRATQHDDDGGHSFHAAHADQLRDEGYDFLAIEETDGRVGVGVILDPSCVDKLEKSSASTFLGSNIDPFDYPQLSELLESEYGMRIGM